MSDPVEDENGGSQFDYETCDNDLQIQIRHLLDKVSVLEQDKQNIHSNFNTQRARLQKLYLQKEDEINNLTAEHVKLEAEIERLKKELDEAKSQICIAGIVKETEVEAEKEKAQQEIATLNRIVQEVSTTSQSEVNRLKQMVQLLESQLNKSKGEKGEKEKEREKEKEGILLAPSTMLSGAKTLARRVVGQLGNDSDGRLQDNLEDSMKKAQEDTEMLRSLVIPLEEKIQDLTTKLHVAELKLKKYEQGDASFDICAHQKSKSDKTSSELPDDTSQEGASYSPKTPGSKQSFDEPETSTKPDENCVKKSSLVNSPSKNSSCDLCANYEAQLVTQQKRARELQKEKEKIERNMEKLRDELVKETQFRKNMEDKWNEKKEEHKAKVAELINLYEGAENEVKNLRKTFANVSEEVKNQVALLSYDREKINAQLEEIQRENDNLMGKHNKHSEQLREESINFPDNVEDLQILLLKTHEELIAAKVAKEAKEEEEVRLRFELSECRMRENELVTENTELGRVLGLRERDSLKYKNLIEKYNAVDKDQKEQIKALKARIVDLLQENKRHEENISKLQSRVGSLQQQLDTSEVVQKDFVRLSQSLQIELEKIRGADTEVRWQHEDDVDECPGCKLTFSTSRKKEHCRHCGKIFCPTCLSHTVLSGPRKRESRVCQVCHTLLNREIAPYFSQEPPHSPD